MILRAHQSQSIANWQTKAKAKNIHLPGLPQLFAFIQQELSGYYLPICLSELRLLQSRPTICISVYTVWQLNCCCMNISTVTFLFKQMHSNKQFLYKTSPYAEGISQFQNHCIAYTRPWVLSPAPQKTNQPTL